MVGVEAKSEEKACPKNTVVEEAPTVGECPTNDAYTEKYSNDKVKATILSRMYLMSLVKISTGKSL